MSDTAENHLSATIALASEPEIPPGIPERRQCKRHVCDGRAEVFLPHGGTVIPGRILNLSMRGCFVEAPAINFERGTHVEVFFETNKLQFRVAGSIAIIYRRHGAGIAFLQMSDRVALQLETLLEELPEKV
jgi:hypothetical protein